MKDPKEYLQSADAKGQISGNIVSMRRADFLALIGSVQIEAINGFWESIRFISDETILTLVTQKTEQNTVIVNLGIGQDDTTGVKRFFGEEWNENAATIFFIELLAKATNEKTELNKIKAEELKKKESENAKTGPLHEQPKD